MPADSPTILALDFDGVVCDGLLEYFQTSWRTYCQIWMPDSNIPLEDLASSFYRLRPVVETGWEMPLLLRAIILGIPEKKILQDWSTVAEELIASENIDAADMGKKLDAVRDEWIATDLDGWLGLHQFYPGVIKRLHRMLPTPKSRLEAPTQLFIVTTKEGRFVKQLLQQQGLQLSEAQIIGKEFKRPKSLTLRQLLETSTGEAVILWFVEDRLKTLQSVQQQPDLDSVKLYLADWGYNTSEHQEFVRDDSRIQLLSLSQFAQDFSAWSDIKVA